MSKGARVMVKLKLARFIIKFCLKSCKKVCRFTHVEKTRFAPNAAGGCTRGAVVARSVGIFGGGRVLSRQPVTGLSAIGRY